MDYIDIDISGKINGVEAKPDTMDIKYLHKVIECADMLMSEGGNRRADDIVTLQILEGSHNSRFYISQVQRFVQTSAVIYAIATSGNLDGISPKTKGAILGLQAEAKSLGVTIKLQSSSPEYSEHPLIITPDTNLVALSDIWVDAEVYLYGTITNAGGKVSPNIHLMDDEGKTYTIHASEEYLKSKEENMLYRYYGVKVKCRQNISSWEIDRKGMQLLDIFEYSPKFDEDYLFRLSEQATARYSALGMSTEEILNEIRG